MSGVSNIIPAPFRGVNSIPAGNTVIGQGTDPVVGVPLGDVINIGFLPATTTNTNDSIKITGALGALSSSNPAYAILMSTATAGRKIVLSATADVTINLTGAHWGAGGKGDLSTGSFLRVYAINDSGTLKWGIGYVGARASVVNTDTSTTATSVTAPEMLLVNSALSAGTWPCLEIGYFNASFDDTGGAAEDLWAVQTGTNNLIVGKTPDGIFQDFNTTLTGYSANPTWTNLKWCQNGRQIQAIGIRNAAGTSNATTVTLELPVKANFVVNGDVSDQQDNGAGLNNHGVIATRVGSVTADLWKNSQKAAWVNVNGKCASFNIIYQAN